MIRDTYDGGKARAGVFQQIINQQPPHPRYVLGLETYTTATIQQVLINAWPEMSVGTRAIIRRDIAQALDDDQLGERIDAPGWLAVLALGNYSAIDRMTAK